MAIRIIPNPTFRARVAFTVPGAERDRRVLVPAQIPESIGRLACRVCRENPAEALSEVIERWVSGVVDDQGDEVPYTPDTLALFLGAHARAEELLEAYLREVFESRLKNSARPPAA